MKKQRSEEEDRLSSLHDDIICKILSLLPETKYAVRTCVLSRRWRNLWTNVPVFEFDIEFCHLNKENDPRFVLLIDNAMSRNITPNILKFRLHYHNAADSSYWVELSDYRTNEWVQTALTRNVVELDIQLMFDGCSGDIDFKLPNCSALQVLRITSDVPLPVSSFQSFINLKKFDIQLRSIDNELSSNLFSCLPKLEELSIDVWSILDNCSEFNIIAPVLRVLDICLNDAYAPELKMKVLIDAPMLEHLFLEDDELYCYTFRNISSSLQARINVATYYDMSRPDGLNHGIQLIRGLSSAKSLTISETTMMVSELLDSTFVLETIMMVGEFPYCD